MGYFMSLSNLEKDFEENTSLNHQMSQILDAALLKSTCPERRVSAAILSLDSVGFRILSVGFNGAPNKDVSLPLYLHKRHCVHAEERAIKLLPPNSQRSILISYSSLAPCYGCAEKLVKLGIEAHVFEHKYYDDRGINYLLDKGKAVYRMRFYHLIPIDAAVRLSTDRLCNLYYYRRSSG